MTDSAPITRTSLAVLTGDENDLLSESPVFAKAANVGKERTASEIMGGRGQAA